MSMDQATPPKNSLIGGLIILVIGLGLIAYNGYNIYRSSISGSWPSVKGTVQSSSVKRINRAKKSDRYQVNIVYKYEVEGKSYNGSRVRFGEQPDTSMEADSIVAKYPVKSEVTVYYQPGNPEEAVLETSISINFITLLLAPLIVLFGLYLLYSSLKQLREV